MMIAQPLMALALVARARAEYRGAARGWRRGAAAGVIHDRQSSPSCRAHPRERSSPEFVALERELKHVRREEAARLGMTEALGGGWPGPLRVSPPTRRPRS